MQPRTIRDSWQQLPAFTPQTFSPRAPVHGIATAPGLPMLDKGFHELRSPTPRRQPALQGCGIQQSAAHRKACLAFFSFGTELTWINSFTGPRPVPPRAEGRANPSDPNVDRQASRLQPCGWQSIHEAGALGTEPEAMKLNPSKRHPELRAVRVARAAAKSPMSTQLVMLEALKTSSRTMPEAYVAGKSENGCYRVGNISGEHRLC